MTPALIVIVVNNLLGIGFVSQLVLVVAGLGALVLISACRAHSSGRTLLLQDEDEPTSLGPGHSRPGETPSLGRLQILVYEREADEHARMGLPPDEASPLYALCVVFT